MYKQILSNIIDSVGLHWGLAGAEIINNEKQ